MPNNGGTSAAPDRIRRLAAVAAVKGVRIGRLFGIDVVADASVLGLAVLLAWALYVDLTVNDPTLATGRASIVASGAAVLFVLGILIHELSHSLVALRRGLGVRQIRLFVFGGFSVIDADDETPEDELVVAIAGPAASVLLAVVMFGLSVLAGGAADLARVLLVLAVANAAIALFNLLPGFPLDGGRVLRALLWRRRKDRRTATETAVRLGRGLGFVVIGVGLFVLLRFADFTGLWWIAVGWFLQRAATGAGAREDLLGKIGTMTVEGAMRPVHDAVPGAMTIDEVIRLYQMGPRLRTLPVEVDGRVRGVIGESEIERLSPARRVAAPAYQVMTPIGPADVVDAATPLSALLGRESGASRRAVVVSSGRVVGMVEGADLTRVFAESGS